MPGIRRPRRSLAALLCGVFLGLSACGPAKPSDPRPLVVVSVVPLQYVVDRLAGPRVRVAVLIPPGANPASHAPSLADRQAMAEAALVVPVGHPDFPFERAWLGPMLAERPDLAVVSLHEASSGERGDDPHEWTAPDRVVALAARLAPALAQLLPAEASELTGNLAAFQAEVADLEAFLEGTLEPFRGRRFFVFHPAWGHFARAYGLEQLAIEHGHKEPGPARLAERISAARSAGARVLFVQPQFSPEAARVVAGEIGARVETLDPLAYDWPANLRHVAQRLAEGLAP
ncbi:MAG: ABC transporter substrate-binding protein [Deltaproteobacteria bacterium]|jgi:zinc transport system substrate-binding protein|nr:ABC transporter substrate-binding protein [Deltaproteobacteria bacterium]